MLMFVVSNCFHQRFDHCFIVRNVSHFDLVLVATDFSSKNRTNHDDIQRFATYCVLFFQLESISAGICLGIEHSCFGGCLPTFMFAVNLQDISITIYISYPTTHTFNEHMGIPHSFCYMHFIFSYNLQYHYNLSCVI